MKRFCSSVLKIAQAWRDTILFAVANLIPMSYTGQSIGIKTAMLRLTGIKCGVPVFVDQGFRCIGPRNITIEHCVSLGHDNHIWAFTPVRIGHHTITAKDLLIISASHEVSSFEPLPDQEVKIGPGCWIGARVTILGGVNIGKGCVVGAGSLVRSSIPDWSVAVGVPARVMRTREPAEQIWSPFGNYPPRELV
jgi:acetyltransferase-like isoleucine patch superfamily enzyme